MGQGPQGPPGTSVNVTDLVASSEFMTTLQNLLINDVNFKNTIQDYFKTNAMLFKGEKGVTEFKLLTNAEQAAVVSQIVKDHLNTFVEQISNNISFQNAIIKVLEKNPNIKGASGKDGVQEKDLKPKLLWCADGDFCKAPSNTKGLDVGNWRLWQNDKGELEFKNLKDNKWWLAKDIIDINNLSDVKADKIGQRDKSEFITGYGGFKTGYADWSNGSWIKKPVTDNNKAINIDNVNIFNRDGLTVNNGRINVKYDGITAQDFTLRNYAKGKQSGFGIDDDGNIYTSGDKTGLKIGNWLLWQNDQGELEFKNLKENKWFLAKNI